MFDVRRHRHVFDPEQFGMPVHIIGCGGMGSRVAEGLVRMGVGREGQSPIALYDGDAFEPHNLSNQWVTIPHLYKQKVVATRALMHEINPQASVVAYDAMVSGVMRLSGVVFICVDSMDARRLIIDEVIEDTRGITCVIETRMDAGVGVVHCFDPNDQNQLACWRMYWFSDDEAENLAGCSGPQSIISAIYATTAMALKQFEHFARRGSTGGMPNRVYQDFDSCIMHAEQWPTT